MITKVTMKFILGTKSGMTQMFDEKGNRIPVTLIMAGPCKVTQVKTKEKDGYESVQIGYSALKEKKVKKSQQQKPFRFIKEFKPAVAEYNQGDEITVAKFELGDIVAVSGISKGKGYAGVVKKHGFSGRNATHGVKHEQRQGGSVGSSFPERVAKGRKMAGRSGFERVTVKNLKVVSVDSENNTLGIKGAVPGPNGALLEVVMK